MNSDRSIRRAQIAALHQAELSPAQISRVLLHAATQAEVASEDSVHPYALEYLANIGAAVVAISDFQELMGDPSTPVDVGILAGRVALEMQVLYGNPQAMCREACAGGDWRGQDFEVARLAQLGVETAEIWMGSALLGE